MSTMKQRLGLIPLVDSTLKTKGFSRSRDNGDNQSGVYDNADNAKSDVRYQVYDDSFEQKESLIRLTDVSTSPVIVGRSHLLTSFRASCNIHSKGRGGKQKIPYRKTHRWGVKALSRKMLRFCDVGMRIRGKHAIVRVNNIEVLANTWGEDNVVDNNKSSAKNQILGGAQEDGWSMKPVIIKPGDILSLEPRIGQGLLEFRVVMVNEKINKEKLPVITTNDYSVKSIASKYMMGESTAQCEVDFKDEYESGEVNEGDKHISSASKLITWNDHSKIPSLNRSNGPSRSNFTKLTESSFVVYFFPFGNGFSSSRRQKLEQNLKILGATILNDVWKAKYIIISESIRSLAVVAKRLCVPEERLVHHLESNDNIRCVLPSWADYCVSSVKSLVIPSRIHAWCHLPKLRTTQNNTKRNILVQRSKDETEDGYKKQTSNKETTSQKKVSIDHDDIVQTRRQCPFPQNVRVAEAFKTLADLHQSMSLIAADTWKSYCFRIIAGRLLELDFEINNDEETQRRLRSIKGFGKSVCGKIQECIEHGTILRIQEFKADPLRQAMKNLKDIWGVGTVRASDMIDRGYRTIDDVRQGIRQNKLFLDRNQLVGVDCYEDILDRMSRSEVEEIGEMVRHIAEGLYPGIETSIMGSYRRGNDSCGDVDIQLCHPAFIKNIPTDALGRIVDALWNEGKVAMHLTSLVGMTTGSHYTDYQKASRHVPKDAWARVNTPSKQTEHKFYMGCLYSPIRPHVRRRVDIKLYPYRERAFATLYFTGNGYFNRSMRLWASRVFGYKLNDHGLFDGGDGKTRVFKATTEQEIFHRLQLIYREPHDRHYWDALEPFDKDVKPILRLTESELMKDRKNLWVE